MAFWDWNAGRDDEERVFSDVEDKERELALAVLGENAAGVRELLDQGVDPDVLHLGTFLIWHVLGQEETAGGARVLELLLEYGSCIDLWRDDDDYTVLHVVAEWGRARYLHVLLQHRRLAALLHATTSEGRTALHLARGAAAAVLLDHGADANRLDARGHSPLDIAAQNDHPDAALLDCLISRGARPAADQSPELQKRVAAAFLARATAFLAAALPA